MSAWVGLVLQRCLVAGAPTGSLDVRAVAVEAADADEALDLLRAEPPATYDGAEGDEVTWEVAGVLAVEPLGERTGELVGFVAHVDELRALATGAQA